MMNNFWLAAVVLALLAFGFSLTTAGRDLWLRLLF